MDLTRHSDDPAAADVLTLLGRKQWRKARDAAKALCKRDRPRYLDLLIAANLGLAREMAAKGLVKEARTVADYLATLAPPELVAALRVEIEKPVASAANPATQGKAGGPDWWEAALKADLAVEEGGEAAPGGVQFAAIDLLVADHFVPSPADGDARALRLAEELAALRTARDATGDGRWDDAREALRRLPRRSVFRHWRMFLRGVRCVFEDDFRTARECFAGLPPAGAPARAARALAPDLVPDAVNAPTTAKVAFYLALSGQPAAWAAPLTDAVMAWKSGKRTQAFNTLLRGMKDRFPSTRADFPAALTDLVVPFRRDMNSDEYHETDWIMDELVSQPGMSLGQRSHLTLAATRAMCVAEAGIMSPSVIKTHWETVIHLWREIHGPDPLRDSLAWQWLGETTLKNLSDDNSSPFPHRSGPNDFRIARAALENAVKHDPDNQQAWISLLDVLDASGDTKTRNRTLDDLCKRFPENKAVLTLAGHLANQRNSFDKALGFLRKAHAIDPLDRDTKLGIAFALFRKLARSGTRSRPTASLWNELETIAEDRPGPKYQIITRWMILLRRSLQEVDPEVALRAREEAARIAPTPAEFALFEHSLALILQREDRQHSRADWDVVLRDNQVTWPVLCALIDQIGFFSLFASWTGKMNNSIRARINQALGVLLRDTLNTWPEGPLEYLEFSESRQSVNFTEFGRAILADFDQELYRELGRHLELTRRDQDPSLRLARLIGEIEYRILPIKSLLENLDSIIEQAVPLQRTRTITRARALHEKMRKKMEFHDSQPYGPADAFSDDDWDEDDDEDAWEDGDEAFPDGGGTGDIPPEALNSFLQALESGDPVALRLMRETLLASGAPPEVVDQIVATAVARSKPSPAKKHRRKKSAKSRRRK